MVRTARSSGCYHATSLELSGTRGSCNCRAPVILPRKHRAILAGGPLMLRLRRDRPAVRFVGIAQLLRRGTRWYSASATVKGNVRVVVHNHRFVINISDIGYIHVGDGAVIEKSPTSPFTPGKTFAEVSEAVIDPTIKPDLRSPIAGIPKVNAVVEPPVARSPEIAGFRR